MNIWQRIKLLFKHNIEVTHWDQFKGGCEQIQIISRQIVDEPKRMFVHIGEMVVSVLQCAYHGCRVAVSPITVFVVFNNDVRRDYQFQREIISAVRRRDAIALPESIWHILYTRYQITRLPFYYRLIKIITREIARHRLRDVDRVYDDFVQRWNNPNGG